MCLRLIIVERSRRTLGFYALAFLVFRRFIKMIFKNEIKLAIVRVYPNYKHGTFRGDFDTFSFKTTNGETHVGKVNMKSLVIVIDGTYIEPL